MARYNLSRGFGRLFTNTIKLFNKLLKPVEPPRPRTPRPPSPAYEREMQELKRQLEEQRAEIERLKSELMEKQRPVVTEVKVDLKKPKIEQESEPEDVPLPFEVELSDYEQAEDVPEPFEVDTEEPAAEITEADTTYKNFGSPESLEQILNFIGDTDRSGIDETSPFFNLNSLQQKALVLDYVQFQHEANPSLFYKGKKALELENVPIWGAEFERFINNTIEFNNTTSGDGVFNTAGMDDLLSELVEEFEI